jgi:hypothetical protein
LGREQRASYNEDLPELIDSLQNVAEIVGFDDTSTSFHTISNQISEIRVIISRANGLLADVEPLNVHKVSINVVKSTYPRQLVIPGGHHDNDHQDITKIKILPTENEIKSDYLEFLPSTDLEQPYFIDDPVVRHLDLHFRLLRHDIFGELKEALGELTNSVTENPALIDNPKLSLGAMRAYPYPKAHSAMFHSTAIDVLKLIFRSISSNLCGRSLHLTGVNGGRIRNALKKVPCCASSHLSTTKVLLCFSQSARNSLTLR